MIPVLFPQTVAIGCSEGVQCRFAGYDPSLLRAGEFDPARVYLLQEELAISISKECRRHGLGEPVSLDAGIISKLSSMPVALPELLAEPWRLADKAEIRICLINGGGGGYGDGILFAPALAALRGRITELLHSNQRIDIYSMVPERTAPVVSHLPGVRVLPMELSLEKLGLYHAFHDFSGMLRDNRFSTMHMTDFYLDCMGIRPDTLTAGDKEPFLPLPDLVAAGIETACDGLRTLHKGRPLVAFIFISTYTRNMPPSLAAEVIAALWEAGWLPVVLMADAGMSARFVEDYGLADRSADLSALSSDFHRYIGLLAGMDAIVSVDTSAVHVGAALHKPTVGLFNSIDKATRIAYSPTVEGVQIRYHGKRCVAPCGLSKARAYISGTRYDGRPVVFECGYACDEAVDREAILARATERLTGLAGTPNPDQELAAIWREATDALHGALSPCWKNVQPAEVVAALGRVLQRSRQHNGMADQKIKPSPGNRGV